MSTYKKLIPSFGCKEGQAIILDEGVEYYSNDLLTLCRYYSDNGADAILIHDLSETECEHERMIGIIKLISREIDTPIITGGYINRLEDVKKYLYAGADAVFLNMKREEHLDLLKEASDRFGSEKIYAYLSDFSYVERVEEYQQLGASVMLLDVPALEASQLSEISKYDAVFFLSCDEAVASTITSYLKTTSVEGVILTIPEEAEGNCMITKQQLKIRGIPVDTFETEVEWRNLKLNSEGLIPVIVQDYKTSEVLMLAYMNGEGFQKTIECGRMTYYSRSREQLWLKGETSGHYQYVKSLQLDCDQDTILAKVKQIGVACHTGSRSCFFQTLVEKKYRETNPLKVLEDVFNVIADRKLHPKEGSYTNYLFDKGIDKILKKLGEEATEIVIAAKNPDPEEIKYEISDFLYHMMVLMSEKGISWEEVTQELANR